MTPDAQTNLGMSDTDRHGNLTGGMVIFGCRLFQCIYPVRCLKTREACEIRAVGRCRSGRCEVSLSQIVLQQRRLLHHQLRGFLGISWASTCGRSTRALPFSRVPEPTLHETPGSHKEALLIEATESLRATGTCEGAGESCRVSCRVINAVSFF